MQGFVLGTDPGIFFDKNFGQHHIMLTRSIEVSAKSSNDDKIVFSTSSHDVTNSPDNLSPFWTKSFSLLLDFIRKLNNTYWPYFSLEHTYILLHICSTTLIFFVSAVVLRIFVFLQILCLMVSFSNNHSEIGNFF